MRSRFAAPTEGRRNGGNDWVSGHHDCARCVVSSRGEHHGDRAPSGSEPEATHSVHGAEEGITCGGISGGKESCVAGCCSTER